MKEKVNKKYKNSVFVDLFYEDESAEENDISLYNALHERKLPAGTKIQKIRVEDVLYMNFYNDISFGAEGKVLVFGEHQSTVSENMPLRNLMYVGRAYEQIVPVRDRYKKKQIMLPRPEFYTFYNGKAPWGKEKVLRLSDAYLLKEGETMLDLSVKIININPEEGHEILTKCPVLGEYSEFVETVRKYQKAEDGEAYRHAIEECIERGILKEYLIKKGSEVVNMLVAEYDYDLDVEVQREEAYEEGRMEGRMEGGQRKLADMIRKKMEKGRSLQGIADDLETVPEEINSIIKKYGLDTDL